MNIVKRCPMCGKDHSMDVDFEKFKKYDRGEGLIQEIFPEMPSAEREFLISGFCPKCQEMLFGNGESENIKEVAM